MIKMAPNLIIQNILLLGSFCLFIACNGGKDNPPAYVDDSETEPQNVTLETFEMTDLNGETVKLSSDRLSFINLWATWCMPCIREMPSLKRLMIQHEGDMDFYFASYESLEKIRNFDRNTELNLPFYKYDDRLVPEELNTSLLPYTVIVKDGNVLYEKTGATEWLAEENYRPIGKIIDEHTPSEQD